MQYQHMKQNFAAYLSTSYPTVNMLLSFTVPSVSNIFFPPHIDYTSFFVMQTGSSGSKRRHESESTPRLSKKRRSNPDSSRCSDMDLDSGRIRLFFFFFLL